MLLSAALVAATAALTAGGYHYAALWPPSRIFGESCVAARNPAEVALTYDDGPNDPYTQQLLDVLARHRVRATFFMIGRFVQQQAGTARAVHAAGHLIGGHTMSHARLIYASHTRLREELHAGTAAIEDAIGAPVRFFRPPFGGRRPELLRQLSELGQIPVMWNVNGHDWDAPSAQAIEERMERGIVQNQRRHLGSNILLHDGGHEAIGTDRRRTVTATANLLAVAPRGGLSFVTIDRWAAAYKPAAQAAPSSI